MDFPKKTNNFIIVKSFKIYPPNILFSFININHLDKSKASSTSHEHDPVFVINKTIKSSVIVHYDNTIVVEIPNDQVHFPKKFLDI